MTCRHPFLYEVETKTGVKKHLILPCGRCVLCRIRKRTEWTIRLVHELGYHVDSCFVTLTYEDGFVPQNGTLDKRAVSAFIKRLRKSIYPVKVKTFFCGEYGDDSDRPHYHGIIFGYNFPDLRFYKQSGVFKIYTSKALFELWPYGISTVGIASHDSIQYTCKYIMKRMYGDEGEMLYTMRSRIPPFVLPSKGIGLQWCLDNANFIRDHMCVLMNGKRVGLPRYYARKLGLELELAALSVARRAREYQSAIAAGLIDPSDRVLQLAPGISIGRERFIERAGKVSETNVLAKLRMYDRSEL